MAGSSISGRNTWVNWRGRRFRYHGADGVNESREQRVIVG